MNPAIGQQLRQAREGRSLSVEQVAQSTHMRVHYLQAMEAGDFDALPSSAQARGFLRTYASFLGLESEPLLAALVEERAFPIVANPEPAVSQPAEEFSNSLEPAETIFAEVGQRLKSQRELLGLSLEDVVRHTHLRRHYLVALDAGDLKGLPSPVQGRGMLKNYAEFLGLDPEPLLLRFAEGLQARLAARQAARTETPVEHTRRKAVLPAPLRRLLSGDMLIGGTLALFLVVFVIWGAIRIFAMRTEQAPSPTAPSIAEVLLAPPDGTTTPSPTTSLSDDQTPEVVAPVEVGAPEATATLAANLNTTPISGTAQTVQVYVTVLERAWMQVKVDGKVEFEGRVLPGSAYSFSGEAQVEILTGNGAALQIFYNQQDLGPLGLFGQVIDQVYTQQGVENPTPTITPTPTPTSRPSATPRNPTAAPGENPAQSATVPALP